MSPEKWKEIKENIGKNFTIEEEGVEDLLIETSEGAVKQGEVEFVIFESPLGRIKLELQKKPKLEEKKYHYSHRAGSAAQMEYKFSDSETVFQLKAYKENDEGEWSEMDAGKISGF